MILPDPSPPLTTRVEGEGFTHKQLWRVVARQIENAKSDERGSFFDLLPAMVFALLSFEAYLNFLGERLAPEIWQDERNFFRREPYRGFDGRVKKIFELCGQNQPDPGQRPYKTIRDLKGLRDFIAHGKVEKILSEYMDHEDASMAIRQHKSQLFEWVSLDQAESARDDVHKVACILHEAAGEIISTDKNPEGGVRFSAGPFDGPLGYALTSHRRGNPS